MEKNFHRESKGYSQESSCLEEMIVQQRKNLLSIARRVFPHLTPEDILQPQDYPELNFDPDFRYEEGVLVGLESALAALRCVFQEYS